MGFPGDGVKALIVGPNRVLRWWIAALLIVAAGLWPLVRNLMEPSLGWRFAEGPRAGVVAEPTRAGIPALAGVTAMEAGGVRVAMDRALVVETVSVHNTYAAQNDFFARHAQLWDILHQPSVRIEHAGGVTEVRPQPHHALGELGLRFWVPWAVALLSLSVGLGMWIYQPRGSATLCYVLSSGGYAFSVLCAASWGSRLLTQPPTGWAALHLVSHLTGFVTVGALCVLFWLHPRRLGGMWLPWSLAGMCAMALAIEHWQWGPGITLYFRLPIVMLGVTLATVYALQWRACRHDARQRAQLKWFGLLLLVSLSGQFVAYVLGAAGHVIKVSQNFTLATVALQFVGLVPLVGRVGLFQLEAWWPRAWLWFLGGLLVVLMDALLVSALHWGQQVAFTVALAIAGWVYFPLRQALWRMLLRGNLPDARAVLPQVLQIVTRAQGDAPMLNARWRALWESVFEPLRMTPSVAGAPAADGRHLRVAATAPLEPLLLELPERGARLFNPADARIARELCDLVRQGLVSAEAFERVAREERRRIASDLHDDLGAQLLTIAQASQKAQERERIAGLARQALEDMRLSVRGLSGEPAPAEDVLADWRSECVTRLAAAGITPRWECGDAPRGLLLPARLHVQLTRVLREAVSNTIRHSGAKHCTVRIAFDGDAMRIAIEDDGRGVESGGTRAGGGHGLGNIERRVRALGGEHRHERPDAGGARLVVQVPLGMQSAKIDAA